MQVNQQRIDLKAEKIYYLTEIQLLIIFGIRFFKYFGVIVGESLNHFQNIRTYEPLEHHLHSVVSYWERFEATFTIFYAN